MADRAYARTYPANAAGFVVAAYYGEGVTINQPRTAKASPIVRKDRGREELNMELNFYGSSDDNFIGGPVNKEDEFYEPYKLLVTSDTGQIIVRGEYTDDGTWSIGIAPVDEDIPIPDWPIRMELADNGYSTRLFITTPAAATVKALK